MKKVANTFLTGLFVTTFFLAVEGFSSMLWDLTFDIRVLQFLLALGLIYGAGWVFQWLRDLDRGNLEQQVFAYKEAARSEAQEVNELHTRLRELEGIVNVVNMIQPKQQETIAKLRGGLEQAISLLEYYVKNPFDGRDRLKELKTDLQELGSEE